MAPPIGSYTNHQGPFFAAVPPDVRKRPRPSNLQGPFFAAVPPDVRKRLCPSNLQGPFFAAVPPDVRKRLCPSGGREIFSWGYAPTVWRDEHRAGAQPRRKKRHCRKGRAASAHQAAQPQKNCIPKHRAALPRKSCRSKHRAALPRKSCIPKHQAALPRKNCIPKHQAALPQKNCISKTCVDTNGLRHRPISDAPPALKRVLHLDYYSSLNAPSGIRRRRSCRRAWSDKSGSCRRTMRRRARRR